MAAPALSHTVLGLLVCATALAPVAMPTARAAAVDEPVAIAVISENGTGSTSAAQSYVDSLMDTIARINGWPSAVGKYFTKRSKARTFIKESKPSFGFLSFGAYLGLRKAHELELLGVADATATGGSQYFVISKEHFTLDECRGQTLATNHSGDPRFIDAVVSGDAFDLADFTMVETKRPVQTLKAVLDGEAVCALVDESQVVAMSKIDGGAHLHPVWSSARLPAIVIVSFGSASPKHVESFKSHVEAICEGDGKDVCDAAGLKAPRRVEADAFADQQTAYDG